MDNLPQLAASIQNDEYRSSVHKILGELLINVVNKYFKGQQVAVDGYRFINCVFEDCELVINRGTFEFHNCKMQIKQFYFAEEAKKTIQLLMLCDKCFVCDKLPPFVRPLINQDGTISIGKGASL
jgi:hypothetical protein